MIAMEPHVTALRILVVDDEPSVVSSVRRELMLSPVGNYSLGVEGFTDTDEALQRARQTDFDIVLTDFRMPKRNGLEFLKTLQAIQPWIESIVLSGDTDMDSLVKMINDTHIYRFIPKPWKPEALRNAIVQAAELQRVGLRHRKLAELLTNAGIGFVQPAPAETDVILIVDADPEAASTIQRDLLQSTLLFDILGAIDLGQRPGKAPVLDRSRLRVEIAGTVNDALAMSSGMAVSCLIVDAGMGEDGGIGLLQQLTQCQPDAALLVWSGSGSMDTLVRSLDVARIQGFLNKPLEAHALRSAVAQALSYRRIHLENLRLAEHLSRIGQGQIEA